MIAQQSVSPLERHLRTRIEREGPITFYEWMKTALYEERYGYYCRPDRIRQGRAGDYRTAPETSPLFGVAFANYFMKSYFDLGVPRQWTIVEAGGGAGHCAHDVLSTLRRDFPKILAATQYVIDEVSDNARSQILSQVAEFKDHVQFRSLADITEPLPNAIIFSNELVDAFPVHRVIARGGALRELYVGCDQDKFIWTENDPDEQVSEYCERIGLELAEGQIYEINLDAEQFVSRAAAALGEGLLITVDYGAERNELISDPARFKGTLRTFHRHRLGDDVLSHPGEQDLTTTVDWTQIIEAGTRAGMETLRFQRLNEFLMEESTPADLIYNQITDPAEALIMNARARELIMPNGLGAAFQVLVQRKAR